VQKRRKPSKGGKKLEHERRGLGKEKNGRAGLYPAAKNSQDEEGSERSHSYGKEKRCGQKKIWGWGEKNGGGGGEEIQQDRERKN